MSDPIKIVIEVTRAGDEYNAEVLHTTKGRPATLLATGDTPGVALKALGLRIDEGLIAQAWDLNVAEAIETAFAHVVPPLDSVREAVMPYRWRNISVGSRSHRDLAFGVKVYLPRPGPPGVITRVIDAIDIRDPLLEFAKDLAVLYSSGKEVPEDKHYAMRIALERRAFYVSWHSPSGYWVNGDGEPFSDVEQARLATAGRPQQGIGATILELHFQRQQSIVTVLLRVGSVGVRQIEFNTGHVSVLHRAPGTAAAALVRQTHKLGPG